MSEKMDCLEAMDLNEAIDLAAAMDLNDAMDPGTLPIQEDKLSVGKLKHGYAPRMLACLLSASFFNAFSCRQLRSSCSYAVFESCERDCQAL